MSARLLLATLIALLALAAPAEAGHYGVPVPDGTMTLHVLFLDVTVFAPAPVSHVDDAWVEACAASEDQPVSCDYQRRGCLPNDLQILCDL